MGPITNRRLIEVIPVVVVVLLVLVGFPFLRPIGTNFFVHFEETWRLATVRPQVPVLFRRQDGRPDVFARLVAILTVCAGAPGIYVVLVALQGHLVWLGPRDGRPNR